MLGMTLGVKESGKPIYGDQLYIYDGINTLAKASKATREHGQA